MFVLSEEVETNLFGGDGYPLINTLEACINEYDELEEFASLKCNLAFQILHDMLWNFYRIHSLPNKASEQL